MAAFPLFPPKTIAPINFDDVEEDEYDSSDDDLAPPELDIDDLNESDEDDNQEEDDDEGDYGGGAGAPAITGEFARIGALRPGPAPFPTTTPFPSPITAQRAVPLPTPGPRFPTALVAPRAPAPTKMVGLKLAVVPPKLTVAPPVLTQTIPTVQATTLPVLTMPTAPVLRGTTPNVPVIPPRQGIPTINLNDILTKMSGITVSTVTPGATDIPADIEDILKKETDETPEDFEARRRLTLQLASIPDYKLNNVAAVTAGLMLMKKAKLGVTYDPDVEGALLYLMGLLQRQ